MGFSKLKIIFSRKTPQNKKVSPPVEEVCVFPLPNVVLLPGAVLPLHIIEERYKLMTDHLIRGNNSIAMSLAKPSTGGKLTPSVICGGGKVSLLEDYPDGRKDVFVEGHKRMRIIKYLQQRPYIKAMAEVLPDVPFTSEIEEGEYHHELTLLTKRWIFLSKDLQDSYINYVHFFTKPHHLADFIGFHFLPSCDEKQQLLETLERKKRVEILISFLKTKISTLEKQDISEVSLLRPTVKVYH